MPRRRPSVEHPCLSCRLPDCDETSSACALKRALKDYAWYVRNKQPAPIEVKDRKNLAYNDLHGDLRRAGTDAARKARIAEAREAEMALAAGRAPLRRKPVTSGEGAQHG